jgi:SAM-dependent methyltransferase
MDETARKVEAHYSRGGLRDRVRAGLDAMGLDPDHLDPDAPLGPDEFHTMGRAATVELAGLAGVAKDERVIDIGCGLGGPARVLAHQCGAQVTGIDLSPEFIEVGRELTTATGLDGRVDLQVGNALDLPFDDDSFDLAWTQHALMNVADKEVVYRQARRVVRDGGQFAFFDIIGGPNADEATYPVPWADDASTSFLASEADIRRALESAGWKPRVWNDLTDRALAFYEAVTSGAPPPGVPMHVLLPDFRDRVMNLIDNTRSGATKVLQAVCDTA